jgi:ABC-type multidrug transport system ATPase subunit
MAIEISITSLQMSDGGSVAVPRGGVLVFVGPNNAGKSVSLREIAGHTTRPFNPMISVKSVDVDRTGTIGAPEATLARLRSS